MNGRHYWWWLSHKNVKGSCFWCWFGTVALALATGEASMPIPESVKLRKGEMATYMDFRDVVHATQSQMLSNLEEKMCSKANYWSAFSTLTADQAFTLDMEMKAKLLFVFQKMKLWLNLYWWYKKRIR
jgi:aconitate hydratase 2/2-methylisocitrate dehydratase